MKQEKHIVIIGNGISGVTAARHIRKLSDYDITIISKETDYFFSRTALMYIYMGHMKYEHTKPYEDHFWRKNRINLIRAEVTSINFDERIAELKTISNNRENFDHISYTELILATGSKPYIYDWKGVNLRGVRGLYSIQDLQFLEDYTPQIKTAVIVGGGLIGIELAEMLHARGIEVHMIVREKSYWAGVLPPEESHMVNNEIKRHHINLHLKTELSEICGNDKVTHIKTKDGNTIACDFVGVTIGVRPNIDFIRNSDLEIETGILVDKYLHTNIPHVYAIGDCAQLKNPDNGRRSIEPIWYTGRMMGEVVAHTICEKKTEYHPGTWFNSAKFFTIEYQVYGNIPTVAQEGFDFLFWQNVDGDKSIRLYYHLESQKLKGIMTMGIRYRAEVCLKWINDGTNITSVLRSLKMANFDPEFSKEYEKELIKLYENQYADEITLRGKRGITKQLLSFLNINKS